mmetsp:Transcript_16267/g.22016  ORF Transcript_16267/g.22016 Transcript_16267/m.22016 type:complete len:87 (+) Transcript_16267:24-284(+)
MTKICNWAHLRALIRNGFQHQKKGWGILMFELYLVIAEGVSMGLNVKSSLETEGQESFAFVMLVMLTPFAFLFSCIYIFSEMVSER